MRTWSKNNGLKSPFFGANKKNWFCFKCLVIYLIKKIFDQIQCKRYFLRSEKKVGLPQIVICSKQAEFSALLNKICFLGLFMYYN